MKQRTASGRLTLGALAVLLGGGAVGGYWYWTNTPQYALLQVQSAYQRRDLATFERYVDIDTAARGAVSEIVDAALAALPAEGIGGTLGGIGGSLLGRVLEQGAGSALKPPLGNALAQAVRGAVSTPREPGVSANQNQGAAARIQDAFRERGIAFEGVESVQRSGETARVTLHLKNERTAEIYPLALDMERQGGTWRVVRWAEPVAFLKRVHPEFLNARTLSELWRGTTSNN